MHLNRRWKLFFGSATLLMFLAGPASSDEVIRTNETVTLLFDGPETSESAEKNPFTDYRLTVKFSSGEDEFAIRGFFAADGNAAESGADTGNKWKCRFSPGRPGQWKYEARMETGDWIAIAAESARDAEEITLPNSSGTFEVLPHGNSSETSAFFSKGRIRADGHYYRHADGDHWLKFGSNSPENLLAFVDFDGTYRISANSRSGEAAVGTPIHKYEPHVMDWRTGDPEWQGGKGHGIVGLVNYLADVGMNSSYFLSMNITGDGKDVWPFASPDDFTRFDCSKLDQWEMLFEHMQNRGIALHVITQETENEFLMDDGNVGKHRKLYFLELISRFAHHPAIVWNIGEESGPSDWKTKKGLKGISTEQQKALADFLAANDPYGNAVLIHTHASEHGQDHILKPLLGHSSFSGLSLQVGDPKRVHSDVVRWRKHSSESKKPWAISMDEIGPADYGSPTDDADPGQNKMRGNVLWGSLLGGASGVEWYFGYKMSENDLNAETLRTRADLWKQTKIARDILEQFDVPKMVPSDGLLSDGDGFCFAEPGTSYLIYRKAGQGDQQLQLDLSKTEGTFAIRWLNPREGGKPVAGTLKELTGGAVTPIGLPPESNADWVASVVITN